MTVLNDNNTNSNNSNNIDENNNNKDIIEKLTEDIKSIEIKQDDKNNNNNTPVFNTLNSVKKETNSIVIDEKLAERLNNIVNEDGKPRIIAHTTTSDSTSFYDEVDIEDMEFDEDERVFFYPCP
ncbi:hypothetical protein DICPUDRAFT_81546, partial [Dictyostelium purpureum]